MFGEFIIFGDGGDWVETLHGSAEELSEGELNHVIEELCLSKAEEFQLLGYEQVTGKDIWNCVSVKYTEGIPQLHRVVNDILSLKVTGFMNWMTMNAYKGVHLD